MQAKRLTEHNVPASKERQRAVWGSGDFSRVASATVIVSEELCEAADVRPGDRVLDVATGSGNGALAAARRWGEAQGIDFVPSLLERARERARAERLHIGFQLGDVEAIPFPTGSFDVVLSVFGAMFALDRHQAAKELIRVCRPGGKIAMASWTPDSFIGGVFRATAHGVAAPAGLESPFRWGDEDGVRELLGGACSLHSRRCAFTFRYRSAQHFLEFYRRYYGPLLSAFEALDERAQDALEHALIEVVQRFNCSGDATMVVPGHYLQVVAIKYQPSG